MFFAYSLFGRVGFSIFLYPVMTYFFLTSPAVRRASLEFLSRVQQHAGAVSVPSRAPGWRQSFRHFLSFGETILDKLAAWRGEIGLEDVDYVNREELEALQTSGQGCVLIASHLGNMEVCRALGSLYPDLKINALVHTMHSGNFNRLMRKINPRAMLSLIQVTEMGLETAMMLREKVQQGEIVVIVGDRIPVGQSSRITWVPFLGHPAPFPQGPFILAALLECPVLLIFCLKRRNRYHIIFEPLAEGIELPRRQRTEALSYWMLRYVERLQHYCVSDPYQWFNFFDFWRQSRIIPLDREP
jgi:predicted LPLAT superfamily acyltransferase